MGAAPEASPMALAELPVVFLDCQATGATPSHGHLLEMAWARGTARGGHEPVVSHLVQLPRGASLSYRVTELTGIHTEDLSDARPAAQVHSAFVSQVSPTAVAVIHFARFERPFLQTLHDAHGQPFVLDIVCTHEICRRLLPSLPRRGLRAIAGYFGHVMHGRKRAADHVAATATVWQSVVGILERRGITTLPELQAFVRQPEPPKPKRRRYPFPRAKRLALPDRPGVYRMLARNGAVLYVGKARSVKQRFNTYFRQSWRGDERKLEMLTQVVDVAVTETASPLEAAVLEADEIKRLEPPYNKALRRREDNCWFVSPLDGTATDTPAPGAVGPLPDADALEPLWLLQSELRRRFRPPGQGTLDWTGRTGEARLGLLGTVWGGPPSPGTFDTGLEQALARAGIHHARLCSPATLLRGGARLYALLRAERRSADAEDDTLVLTPPEGDRRRVWTPDRVREAIEKTWSRAAHLWRRARWLCRLSESVIVWQPSTGSGDGRRVLIIEGGTVTATDGEPPPAPPGFQRTTLQRQLNFHRETYDRLRVLTTELRRLCSEGAGVSVTLSPEVTFRREVLAGLLRWV